MYKIRNEFLTVLYIMRIYYNTYVQVPTTICPETNLLK